MMGQPQVTLIDRGIIPVEESITAIAAEQGKLYVATAGKEIRIYDVSDPSQILELESLPVTLPVKSLAINGGHLFVAAGTDGLHVLDLSVSGKPETVATYPVPSESLYPAGRLVYMATGSNGLHLLTAGPIATAIFNAQVAPGGSFSFSPDPININTGDTVNWSWGGNFHSTTSGISPNADGIWDSGVHNVPFSFQHTFNTAGNFPYFCSVHGFTGTVIVANAGPVINMSVNPTTIDFGGVNVGQFSDQTVTISNDATSNATLSGNVGALSAPFSVQSGGGPFSLTPGQSVVVTVRFSPTAEGAAATSLSIIHNATNRTNPASVPLVGTGVTPGVHISVNPASLSFGNVTVGQSPSQNVTILNQAISIGPLIGSVGALTGPFSIVSGGDPFNLPPGQSQIVTVSFSPTVAGVSSDTLIITHNATEQVSPTSIPLSGTGAAPGINISVNPASVNFGNATVGQSPSQNITITNQATSTAALTGSVGALSAPFSVVSGGGGFDLNPGQSVTVTVQFSPTTAGTASDNLSITHNATNQASPSILPVDGTGVIPGAAVVVSFISAPTQGKPGGRIPIQNTLTNQGSQTAATTTVNFYLSTDTQIDTSDVFIGKRTVRNLAPGASSGPVSTMVTVPRSTVTGSYFVGAIVGTNTNFDPDGITVCLSLSKPRLLTPRNRGTNISTTPTLTWAAVNGASTYEVQVATDKGFTNIVASTAGLTDAQWPVTPALSNGTPYFWHVGAANLCGSGPFSATSSFKTAP
jgi:plastocyanin